MGANYDAALLGRFDEGIWKLLSEPVARHQIREALVARYFPEERERLGCRGHEKLELRSQLRNKMSCRLDGMRHFAEPFWMFTTIGAPHVECACC